MLEKSFGLLFYLKPSRNQETEKRYIYLRITVDGKSRELSAMRQWEGDRWNVNRGRAVGNTEDVRVLNAYLNVLQTQVFDAKKAILESGRELTAELLRDYLKGNGEDKKMILELFQHHNDQLKALVGIDYAAGTAQRYKTSLDHTRSFIESKYGVADLDIKKLDYEFISEYSFWLKTVRRCGHNSTVKYLANFKKIVLDCVKKGWLTRDPFVGFKLTKKEVIREVLTPTELNSITTKDFEIERISQVRDIFVFCCYTGLAYVDVKKLRRSDIVTGIDGEKWIHTSRQKTEAPTRVPLLPVALKIVKRYEDHPYCSNTGTVLPVLSNQKMNAYLKEIADLCGITKLLTFHIARHTFATTVTLSNGVPIETVSKMLGHRSLKQTQHYAKILDVKISTDMQALRKKLNDF